MHAVLIDQLSHLSFSLSLSLLSISHILLSTMSQKVIVIVGATGNQGSGVVEALVSESTQFKIRAMTTNAQSARAKILLERYSEATKQGRFELIEANLNDKASLEKALGGSYGLFASFGPGATPESGEEGEEVKQGKNLVDAAKVS